MIRFEEDPIGQPGAATWERFRGALHRRWKIVVLGFCATLLGTYVTLQVLSELYETSASLMVKVGRENAELPATVQNGGLMAAGVKKEEVNSEISMLSSRPLMEKVVNKIGVTAFMVQPPRPDSVLLLPKYYAKKGARWLKQQATETLIALNLKKKLTDYETVVTGLDESLEVEVEKNSNIINLRLRMPDPQLGQRVLQELVHVYLNQHTAVYRNPAVKDFFDQELRQNRAKLRALGEQRDEIRARHRLSAAPEQEAMLLKEQSELARQIHSDEGERAMMSRELSLLRDKIAEQPEQVLAQEVQSENPSIQSIRDRITTLQLEHAKLASRYQPDAGPVVKNEEEITELKSQLAKEPATVPGKITSEANPVRRSFEHGVAQNEIHIAGLEAKDEELLGPTRSIEQRLRTLDQGQDELETVQREIKAAEVNFETYAKHLEEARISDELDERRIANVAILSLPATAYEPVYPRKLLIMRLALPLGLLLGILLALWMEYLDDTIHNENDVQRIDELNYLGSMREAA